MIRCQLPSAPMALVPQTGFWLHTSLSAPLCFPPAPRAGLGVTCGCTLALPPS